MEKAFFKTISDIFLDFVYPATCMYCGAKLGGGKQICSDCWDELFSSMKLTFQKNRADFHHLIGEIFFDEVVTCWSYTPEIGKLVHRIKYQRGKKLAVLIGNMVGEALKDYSEEWRDGIIVPVPLHKVRYRERGYNQSNLLSAAIASKLFLQTLPDFLVRYRNTSTQTKLSAEERQKNVEGAFGLREINLVAGKQVVLVDDVITTGATMNSCASVLKEAGAKKIVGIALARPTL
ncbi:MAG: hypothetical protein DRP89_04885 [Candidatus Neomarinimicrobiota bacterium]|nr:MAG: hypothetical protein DRP89_04885 [Candidatus Neomarinimicrobiota bacterium]